MAALGTARSRLAIEQSKPSNLFGPERAGLNE
jgi:hypothetical protein